MFFGVFPLTRNIMKKKNIQAINVVANKARLMYNNFSALEEIMRFDDQASIECNLSKYLSRREDAKTPATRARWNYEIVSLFHSAAGILWNGKHHYKDDVINIDMVELKEYLREKARFFLAFKPSASSWQGKVRQAALKSLDLEELI